MSNSTRRDFIKKSMATVAGIKAVSAITQPAWGANVRGANDDIRVAIVGLKGKGQEHLRYFRLPGVRIAAICDCDTQYLEPEIQKFKDRGEKVNAYIDYRKLLDDKEVDVVVLPIPDHWHALATVWACQAGKDVYVEKPTSHGIWEGRKMVEAAHKYNRIVGAGSQERSDVGLIAAAEHIKSGKLGAVKNIRALSYNQRQSIGRANGPQTIPPTCDYSLFQGPATMTPLMRLTLHYEWHWFWETGTGEMGNLGGHVLDDSRWMTGLSTLPTRAMCIGGRFGFNDDGETPNTQITYYEYEKTPVIYEICGIGQTGRYKTVSFGVVIQCENGYFAGGRAGGWTYDNKDRRIQQFPGDGGGGHVANFIEAVRSRKVGDLKADVLEGHISACLCHMGNISYRLGRKDTVGNIKKSVENKPMLAESFDRFVQYLQANKIDLNKESVTIGPMLTMDPEKEVFTGDYSSWANMLLKRNYRQPFVVPDVV